VFLSLLWKTLNVPVAEQDPPSSSRLNAHPKCHDVSEGENEALQRIHIIQTAADEVIALFSHTKTELVKYRSS
jgi:hypothetical protein